MLMTAAQLAPRANLERADLVAKLLFRNRRRRNSAAPLCCARETEFRQNAFPNGVWERGRRQLLLAKLLGVILTLLFAPSSVRADLDPKANSPGQLEIVVHFTQA